VDAIYDGPHRPALQDRSGARSQEPGGRIQNSGATAGAPTQVGSGSARTGASGVALTCDVTPLKSVVPVFESTSSNCREENSDLVQTANSWLLAPGS
jgi:hypothetical protein